MTRMIGAECATNDVWNHRGCHRYNSHHPSHPPHPLPVAGRGTHACNNCVGAPHPSPPFPSPTLPQCTHAGSNCLRMYGWISMAANDQPPICVQPHQLCTQERIKSCVTTIVSCVQLHLSQTHGCTTHSLCEYWGLRCVWQRRLQMPLLHS